MIRVSSEILLFRRKSDFWVSAAENLVRFLYTIGLEAFVVVPAKES